MTPIQQAAAILGRSGGRANKGVAKSPEHKRKLRAILLTARNRKLIKAKLAQLKPK